MTAMLQQHSARTRARATFGVNEIQPVGVLPLARRLASKGDIA